jgi:hypothetical protein
MPLAAGLRDTPAPKDKTDAWIQERINGGSFVDLGGVGVDSLNERVTFAKACGASPCIMADIRQRDWHTWVTFRRKLAAAGVAGVIEVDCVDVRKRQTLERVGICDIVHCTGVLYHLQSPAEALWNLRTITGRFLITNTITFPRKVENEFGEVDLPDYGVLFTAALNARDRRVLNKYYSEKFGWTMDRVAPDPDVIVEKPKWIEEGELTCLPVWYMYSQHAFRSLLRTCRLKVIDEWTWQEHAQQVLCEIIR